MAETPIEQLIAERRKKLEHIKNLGIEPFSHRFKRSQEIEDVVKKHSKIKHDEKLEKVKVALAGRIKSLRRHGGGSFIDLEDKSGKIQLWITVDTVGKEVYDMFEKIDIGDIVGVRGYIFKTKRGELTVWVEEFQLLAKSLRPLPSTWFGLKDVETRYRQRYVDLIMNPEVKRTFEIRSKIIQAVREYFVKHGYLEVETPILQPVYGGAFARPFETHHNTLDMKMYLRISNEMYLKRLIVGGLEKVFEFSPDFRNEGIDTSHNPEFLMVEAMTAYKDYKDGMKLIEDLTAYAVKKALGTTKVTYQGTLLDFTTPWKKMTMVEAIKEHTRLDVMKCSESEMKSMLKSHGIEAKEDAKRGKLIALIFEEFVEPKLIQPTIIYDYPVEVSALSARCEKNPQFTERFEQFIAGMEGGNNYTEINDPIELRKRFVEELKRGKSGDEEAHPMDEDFLRAMEYGMPPTCGIAIGIDRLVMMLTNASSIRDVILFPALRKTKEEIYGDEDKSRILKK
jgi:lysyl-tRNA synthetase class 2